MWSSRRSGLLFLCALLLYLTGIAIGLEWIRLHPGAEAALEQHGTDWTVRIDAPWAVQRVVLAPADAPALPLSVGADGLLVDPPADLAALLAADPPPRLTAVARHRIPLRRYLAAELGLGDTTPDPAEPRP